MRSFGIGLLGVVLGVFLYREGFSSTAIGLMIAAGLAGAATGTVFITFKADHLGRRRTLFVLSLLTAAGVTKTGGGTPYDNFGDSSLPKGIFSELLA